MPTPVRIQLLGLLIFVATALSTVTSSASAQQPQPRGSAQSRATATLEQLEAVLDRPESERIAVVRGLGRKTDQGITTALLDELERAVDPAYRQALVEALGAVQRDGVLPALAEVVVAAASPPVHRSIAARGMARQGEAGVRQLGEIARQSEVAMARTYATMALSQSDTELGWQLLAEIVRDGDSTARQQGIRYLQRAPALEVVTAARVAAAGDQQISTAASAVRQLAEQRHPQAAALITELCDRKPPAQGIAAVDLLYAVGATLTPKLHEVALQLAGAARRAGSSGNRALEELLPKLTADAGFLGFVRARLGKVDDPQQVRIALELLTTVPGEDVTAEIVAFAGARDVEVVSTALQVLAERGDASALPELQTLLRSKDEGRRLEALQCIHALRGSDPSWHDELLELLRKSARSRRASAEFGLQLSLLGELGSEEALPTAWNALDHKEWPVRAAAIDFCRQVRSVDSIPKLVDRLDEESGRLREDLLDTLRSLTAMRFEEQKRWRQWWKDNRPGFELIPADAFAKEEANRRRPRGATASSYYGIPLVSDRVVFVVDVSGSMSAQVGTDASRTRLDEAKQQLRRVVEGTPEHFVFNVVAFETGISTVFDSMEKMGRRRRAEALERIDALKPMGGTNVHDGLLRAFEEQHVDTIYLLSDGSPSAGPITDPDQLADAIRRWNQTRRLRIHCISIGADSPMLRRIATESGGEYASSR